MDSQARTRPVLGSPASASSAPRTAISWRQVESRSDLAWHGAGLHHRRKPCGIWSPGSGGRLTAFPSARGPGNTTVVRSRRPRRVALGTPRWPRPLWHGASGAPSLPSAPPSVAAVILVPWRPANTPSGRATMNVCLKRHPRISAALDSSAAPVAHRRQQPSAGATAP